VRVNEGLGVSAEVMDLARVPQIDLLALPRDRRPGQPVAGNDRAAQNQVGQFVLARPLPRLLEVSGLIRQDAQRLVEKRYAVALESPNPAPSRSISHRSRNQARAKRAWWNGVSLRVPRRVPRRRHSAASSLAT
jgi:hypothetical protein